MTLLKSGRLETLVIDARVHGKSGMVNTVLQERTHVTIKKFKSQMEAATIMSHKLLMSL